MPVVRTRGGQGVVTQPAPVVRRTPIARVQVEAPTVSAAPTADAFGANVGEALQRAGLQLHGEALQLEAEQRRKSDQSRVMSAETDLLGALNGWAHNPESGALLIQGRDALALPDKAQEFFRKQYGDIWGQLANKEQKEAFETLAMRHGVNFRDEISRHVGVEVQKFEMQDFESLASLEAESAIYAADKPAQVTTHVLSIANLVTEFGKNHGAGQPWIQQQIARRTSEVYVGIVNRYLDQGQDIVAEEYFEAMKQKILPHELGPLEKKLAVSTTEGQAARVSNTIWQMKGPKNDTEPASLDVMIDLARGEYAESDPKLFRAIGDALKDRTNTWNVGVHRRAQAGEANVWKAVLGGINIDQLRSSQEFLALPGERQNAIVNAVTDRLDTLKQRARGDEDWLWAKQQRARTRTEQAEQDKTRAAYGLYWDMSSLEKLDGMSEAQITNQVDKLGLTLTNALLERKRSIVKGSKVFAGQIDDDLFKELADSAGLHPYDAKTTDQKSRLGNLRSAVERQIATEEQSRKRELTREEKRAVMQTTIDRKVMLDIPWGRDVQVPAVIGGRGAYVPVGQIPPDVRGRLENLTRSYGAPITNGKLQRAYAAALRGDDAAVDAILREK